MPPRRPAGKYAQRVPLFVHARTMTPVFCTEHRGRRGASRRFRGGSRRAPPRVPTPEVAMTDLSILVVTAALFGAAFFFVRLCERM